MSRWSCLWQYFCLFLEVWNCSAVKLINLDRRHKKSIHSFASFCEKSQFISVSANIKVTKSRAVHFAFSLARSRLICIRRNLECHSNSSIFNFIAVVDDFELVFRRVMWLSLSINCWAFDQSNVTFCKNSYKWVKLKNSDSEVTQSDINDCQQTRKNHEKPKWNYLTAPSIMQ